MTIEVRKDQTAGTAVVTVTTSIDRLDSLLAALSLTEETIAGKNGGETSFVPLSSSPSLSPMGLLSPLARTGTGGIG